MPNWLAFALGIVATHVAYAIVFGLIWWRVISREPQPPVTHTEVERIVRPFGTLTYSRRN